MVGDNSLEVDWRRSFYLNLIAHTSFTVTVAICSNQVLQNHRAGKGTPLNPIYKVLKTVYASPSRVNFHLDARKEAETVPAYPDICFAIDDFDSTIDTVVLKTVYASPSRVNFHLDARKEAETVPAYPDICFAIDDFDSTIDTVVLSDTDHCYCVILNAHAGAAFPNEDLPHNDSQKTESNVRIPNETKVTIFSGFVSYQMVREAFDAGKYRLGSLLSFNLSPGKPDRLYMKGPGGRGEVEVAVSGVEDQSQHERGPSSPIVSKSGFGLATIAKRAATFASVAKQAYAAASRNIDDEMLPLKCCLMSISLPWEHIAYDLLFKGGPAVNM